MEQEVFRKDQLDELTGMIRAIGAGKIFVVRGDRSFFASGAEAYVRMLTGGSDADSFHDFDPNPQLEDLTRGVEIFRNGNYDLILAIGGGSVLDMGKLISVFAHQESDITGIVTGKSKVKEIKTPLLAVPTTAGSGAEATKFAVLYIEKQKFSIEHPLVLPDYVYLFSGFTLSASPYLTAYTGLDAFCQAVESAWSVNSNPESEKFALRAIDLVWNHLQQAVDDGSAPAKEKMAEAAYLAGRAINITRTTAPHALSYAFTSYYNIPHGHAVALSLPFFISFNHKVTNDSSTDPRGPGSVKERIEKVLDILKTGTGSAPALLADFFNGIGITMNPYDLIDGFDPQIIIDHVNMERLTNNPRIVTKKDILTFLQDQKNKSTHR
ncbi:MAG: phosphonoacetaldehyde reductase [Bacteroidales bacterium]